MADTLALKDIWPPPEEAFTHIPAKGSEEHRKAVETGNAVLGSGRMAALILNGGMATRFAGVVKGVDAEVLGRSFLYWKLSLIRAAAPSMPVYLMNSPFTHEVTLKHLAGLAEPGEKVECFVQSMYPRETLDGKPFTDPRGKPSLAGRGHGDMLECFTGSGMLENFVGRGCDMILVSNVDNLGAVPDPVLAGLHILGKKPVSLEVAPRKPEHKGGVIASVRGNVQLLEGIRWPEGLDLNGFGYFNTNSIYLSREALSSPPDLRLHRVIKEVGGTKVVQREKVLGEVTEFFESSYLVVSDRGGESRFIPVKTPQQLEASLGTIRSLLEKWDLL